MQTSKNMRFTELAMVPLENETEINRKRTWSQSSAKSLADLMSESERRKSTEEVFRPRSTNCQANNDQTSDRHMQTGLYPPMSTAQTFTSRMMRSIESPQKRTTTATSAREDENDGREVKRRMIETTDRVNNEKVIYQKNCEIRALKDQLKTQGQEMTEMKRLYENEKYVVTKRANMSVQHTTEKLTNEFEERKSKIIRENRKQLHEQRCDYDLKILKLLREKEQITLGYRRQPLHFQYFKDRINQFETIQQCNSWKMDLDKITKEIDQKKVKSCYFSSTLLGK
jgi:hypothetical protein